MTEQAVADYCCPYAEKETISKFLKAGRTCKISEELCFNWDSYAAVVECQIKKKRERENGEL